MDLLLNLLSLKPKIEKFCEEFFVLDSLNCVETKWAFQVCPVSSNEDIAYYPPKCGICPDKRSLKCSVHKRQLIFEHLYDHFSQQEYRSGNLRKGTLAFVPNFHGQTKTLIIDFDSSTATEALYLKIIPELDRLGIDHYIETPPEATGVKYDKAHLTIKTELMDIKPLKIFIELLLEHLEIDKKELKLELFPTHKNSLMRLVGGRHLRRDCVYESTHKDRTVSDPEDILDLVNSCGKMTEEFVKDYIKQNVKIKPPTVIKKTKKKLNKFHYVPLNLPLDPKVEEGLPEDVKTLATNCQAINKLMNLVYEASLFNEDGVHNEVKFIANLNMENDIRNCTQEGETWFYNAIDATRDRPEEKHNWWKKEEYEDNPNILIPTCAAWEDYFDLCKGCIWKNYEHFTNPRQLRFGKQLNKHKIRDIKLSTVEEIRATTLKEVCDRATDYVVRGVEGKDLLIASPPSAGKTYATDLLAVQLAEQGYNILIAVPSGDLGDQHIAQIRNMGGNAFILKSHDAWFKMENGKNKSGLKMNCPEKESISRLVELGLGSKAIQKKFCATCPFLESCPYPGQYGKAALPNNNIVIIQHAHFGCRETMYALFRDKQFDLLIVDEEFISNINKDLKVTELELALMTEQQDFVAWVAELLLWFEGKPPSGDGIKATETELEIMKNHLESRNCLWNIPEYITHYNSGKVYDKQLGLFVFYPIPDIPVRIFTDATPPLEMLEIVLDNTKIEVFGKSEVLNLQASNSGNQIIQVLDSSTSKSALSKNEYELFYEILEFIGDDITKSFPSTSEEILLTLYKDEKEEGGHHFTSRAEEWLRRNYPNIFEQHKIIFGRLALGTNDYQNCAAQYQIAGLHYNTLQLAQAAYKLKCMANFWNRIKGRPLIPNMYPWNVTEKSPMEVMPMPLRRIEIDPVEGPGYFEYDFDDDKPYAGLYQTVPMERYLQIAFFLARAKKQQAMRIIRNKTDKMQKVVIFDKEERPTQATNVSLLLHDLVGYLR